MQAVLRNPGEDERAGRWWWEEETKKEPGDSVSEAVRSLHDWLRTHLACPRDFERLNLDNGNLICRHGHTYPVIDDVPVMLLDDVDQTASWATKALEETRTGRLPSTPSAPANAVDIDPWVQDMVAKTCGHLYQPLVGRLQRYPIPNLRLPPGTGKWFLDVGCNWGRWSVAAARKGYLPVSLDVSLQSVLAARRVCRQLGHETVCVVGDARYLPFLGGSFDVVFSYSVLQHFSRKDALLAFQSMARVLDRDRTALIQMAGRFGARSLYHQARRGFREATGFDVRYWSPSELRAAFGSVFSDATISVDGYFGLGIQPADADMLPWHFRVVVHASEALRRMSLGLPLMTWCADSVYLEGTSAGREPQRSSS